MNECKHHQWVDGSPIRCRKCYKYFDYEALTSVFEKCCKLSEIHEFRADKFQAQAEKAEARAEEEKMRADTISSRIQGVNDELLVAEARVEELETRLDTSSRYIGSLLDNIHDALGPRESLSSSSANALDEGTRNNVHL